MKTFKPVFLVLLLTSFNLLTIAQNSLQNAVYLTPFSFNKPLDDFGFSKKEVSTTLNSVGFGIGVGYLFYFTEEDVVNLGADITFAEFNFNFFNVGLEGFYDEELCTSTMYSMKLGPVITIVPENKIGLDIYCQFMFAISGFDYIHEGKIENVSAQPQYRIAPGIRFGYNVMYFNFEYNWGQPTVKQRDESAPQGIRKLTIDQSFFKFGIMIKFRPFK